jgi:photosystem II stability/assembly factor-like uncharacterized protein
MAIMGRLIIAVAFAIGASSTACAQAWLDELKGKPETAISFADARDAFNRYYEKHPIDARKDRVRPLFAEAIVEPKERLDIEAFKLFKRWEWLIEPRIYPSGKLDVEKINSIKLGIPKQDKDLMLRQIQGGKGPFGITVDQGVVRWPMPNLWTQLGPSDAVSGTNLGRVNSIKFDPGNSAVLYLGSPDGGVWKSVDGGLAWKPLFDSQPTLSVGDVAISFSHSNVLYVSTSDPFGYGTPFWGGTYSVGVMKSTDGGTSWTSTGLTSSVAEHRVIRRLVIHPTDDNILLAATSDGTYRTADGGSHWTRVQQDSSYDAEFQADDGNIAYITTDHVLKSGDAGLTFTALSASCGGSRFNVEVSRSQPTTLYTLCTDGVVQKSTDAGSTWQQATTSGVQLYGYYDNVLAVSPVDPNVLFVAGFDMRRSTDGGKSWSAVPAAMHPDNHCIAFVPGSSSAILVGNDGGVFKTTNSGSSWTSLNKSLAITQFYGLGISRTNASLMELGAQDNGNMKFRAGVFESITNADGMRGFIDWSNPNVIYSSIQNGGFYRSTDAGATFVSISTPAAGAWVSPWQQDATIPNTIYAATDKVYKSKDRGGTWSAISGSLSGIDQFRVLRVAPSNSQFAYAGDGQHLYRTQNGGANWSDITHGLPTSSNFLTDVCVHDNDPKVLYVTFSGYMAGEKVYRSNDAGTSWTNISGSLPNLPANTIIRDRGADALYVGTDSGVYYRNASLSDWVPYKLGLPNVIVDQLQIHYGARVLRAATYGRGVWEAPLK